MKDEVIKVIGKTYQLKALELANETISSLCLSSCRGCAGIGRQLHPLKAKDLMMGKVSKTIRKNDKMGQTYQSKALELANATISSLCLSSCRGCAWIGRQLHPMKAKNLMSDEVLKIRWKNDMRGFKSKSIKRSRAHKFNYPTVTSASTSRVRWNRSSTASLEGERFETDKIGLSSRWCLSYTFF